MKIQELNINSNLLKAVNDLGFTEATGIQAKCIPEILAGKDVFGQSSTGSGKTAAFGLPILQMIQPNKTMQVLILTPTRELCVQVTDSMRDFAKYSHLKIISIYGGVSIQNQFNLIPTADIIVATPGRVLDHLERKTINLHNVKFFVLDEADKMFDMGMAEDVERIIRHLPKERQTLLFSATLAQTVKHIVMKHMNKPVMIQSDLYVDKSLLKQCYYDIENHEKFSILMHLLTENSKGLSIVFCATRRQANAVGRNLQKQGVKSMSIHGGLNQNQRLRALQALRDEHINVLVATDVAARGLDIKNVHYIYNYDVSKTSEEYVHRIGRTARAGEEGNAITLLTSHDHDNFGRILRDHTLKIERKEKPAFAKVFFTAGGDDGSDGGRRPSRFGGSRGGSRVGYGGNSRSSRGGSRGDSRSSYGGSSRSSSGSYGGSSSRSNYGAASRSRFNDSSSGNSSEGSSYGSSRSSGNSHGSHGRYSQNRR